MGGFGGMEDHVRRNMEMFERAFSMFTPFPRREQSSEAEKPHAGKNGGDEINDLKRQMEEMQRRLDRLGRKE